MAASNSTESAAVCAPKICEDGGGGLFLPFFSWESSMTSGFRALMYGGILLWCFLGLAIVTDQLNAAINKITSRKIRRFNKKTLQFNTAPAWNDTVASLTLLAIGSGAPEILFTVVELWSRGMLSGGLGPSLIVGSAAFNLLLVGAFCNHSVGAGEVKLIKRKLVYGLSAFFAIAAYLWLYIILSVRTPDVVDVAEGGATVGMYPVLLFLAWIADETCCCRRRKQTEMEQHKMALDVASMQELANMEMLIMQRYGSGLADDKIVALMEHEFGDKASRAHYRMHATGLIVGGRPVRIVQDAVAADKSSKVSKLEAGKSQDLAEEERQTAVIEFVASGYAILENSGTLELAVRRRGGPPDNAVTVRYKTRDGTAKAGQDYVATEGTLEFTEADQERIIKIDIIDDFELEEEEHFFVDLLDPHRSKDSPNSSFRAKLGDTSSCKCRVIDDDDPGILSFDQDEARVLERIKTQAYFFRVARSNGSRGQVTCKYRTEDATAIGGLDYEVASGTLTFADGQLDAVVGVNIKPRRRVSDTDQFRLILEEPSGGARLAAHTDGGQAACILTVVIEPDQAANDRVERVTQALRLNMERLRIGHGTWKDQLFAALLVNGGDDEAEEPPTVGDYLMHLLCVSWKFAFALIPPVDYCNGWICFWCSLGAIAVVTALIGDLAALFGCCLGLQDSITAITVLALGTSLPDIQASATAARQDTFADASLGNIMGSIPVNVFLGLGIPWLWGAVHWEILGGSAQEWTTWVREQDTDVLSVYPEGGQFVVVGGNLSFSMAAFAGCALVATALFAIRRCCPSTKGELGGRRLPRIFTSFSLVLLYAGFVAATVWTATSNPGPCG